MIRTRGLEQRQEKHGGRKGADRLSNRPQQKQARASAPRTAASSPGSAPAGSPGWAFPEPGDGCAQKHGAGYKGPWDRSAAVTKVGPGEPPPSPDTTQAHPAKQGPPPLALEVGDLPRYHRPAHRTPSGPTGHGRNRPPQRKAPGSPGAPLAPPIPNSSEIKGSERPLPPAPSPTQSFPCVQPLPRSLWTAATWALA